MWLKDKRAVSELIGYVLLVVFAVIMSAIVYTWLNSYVPAESLECKDGVSVFLKEASFENGQLTLVLRNNGRFNLTGFFAHATNSSDQDVPNIDLSRYLKNGTGYNGKRFANSVLFYGEEISFKPGDEASYIFNLPVEVGQPYSIRVVPTRFEDIDGKQRFVSCTNGRVTQIVGEPIECVPNTCGGLGYTECDPPGWGQDDGCGGFLTCGTGCVPPMSCSVSGQCESPPTNCGDGSVGGTESCDNATANGMACNPDYGAGCAYCSSLCQVVAVQGGYCGDGVKDVVEGCDDGDTLGSDGCSATCTIETGWSCTGTTLSTCTPICGDGLVKGTEGCDDGGTASGNGCSSTCTVESGYSCSGAPSSCAPVCGDGIIISPETCDQGSGNVANGDGCSSTCTIESGYTCTGTPSSCSGTAPSCPNTCIAAGYAGNNFCTNSPGNCNSNGGTYLSSGDQYCTGGSQADTCCCKH